uniref:GCR092 n=1 Tax=Schmidtea mediterranea TaxID=79327 RepID=A0A193KUB1_SCHMD|nr:GCR092 [Schmidtea mediterranea]
MKTNLSDSEYLNQKMGPPRDNLFLLIPLNIIYSIIFVLGILGNTATCLVISRVKFMQSPTNFYLLNLSVTDLLILIIILPQDLYQFWVHYPYPFGHTICFLKSYIGEICVCTSVLTVIAFTVERYCAICQPHRCSQAVSGSPNDVQGIKRTFKIIILLWLISFIVTLPLSLQIDIDILTRNDSTTNYKTTILPTSAQCTFYDSVSAKYLSILSTILLFVLPLAVIIIMYTMIGIVIRKSMLQRRHSHSIEHFYDVNNQTVRARKAILKILIAVVIVFFVCFLPHNSLRLMVAMIPNDKWTPRLYQLHNIMFYVSGILFFLNSVINPILYNVFSLKFRKALQKIIISKVFKDSRRMRYQSHNF